jgi:hypothetical protein
MTATATIIHPTSSLEPPSVSGEIATGELPYALAGLPDAIDEGAGEIDVELGKVDAIAFAIENESARGPDPLARDLKAAIRQMRLSLAALRTAARYAKDEMQPAT